MPHLVHMEERIDRIFKDHKWTTDELKNVLIHYLLLWTVSINFNGPSLHNIKNIFLLLARHLTCVLPWHWGCTIVPLSIKVSNLMMVFAKDPTRISMWDNQPNGLGIRPEDKYLAKDICSTQPESYRVPWQANKEISVIKHTTYITYPSITVTFSNLLLRTQASLKCLSL